MEPINTLNVWGGMWAEFMWARLIDGAVVLSVVGTLWLLIRRWASAQVGYCLFLLVLIKLMVPMRLTVPQWLADRWPQRTADRAAGWVSADPPARVVRHEDPGTMAEPPSADQPAPTRPRLSIQAVLMLSWAGVVAGLVVRFAWVQARTHRLLRRASPVDPRCLPIDLAQLRRLAGVRRAVRILSSDAAHCPAAWGLLRPSLIVPPDLLLTFTPGQMRWVLLHELAHIRRADVLVATGQKLLAIGYFFSPVVWVANLAIDLLREYACDDTALLAAKATCRDCGEGFLSVVRCANRLPGLAGTPVGLLNRGILIRRRLMRILDTHRTVRTRLSAGTAVLVLTVGAVLLPSVQAAENEAPAVSASPSDAAGRSAAKPNLLFEKFPIEQINYYVTQGQGPPPMVGKPFDFCKSQKCLYWPCRPGVTVQSGLLFDESAGTGTGYDKLYVDFNGDGDFADEQDAVYQAAPCSTSTSPDQWGTIAAYFEDVYFTQNPERQRYAHAQVFLAAGIRILRTTSGSQTVQTHNCLLVPQQWAVGTVTIGGKQVRAALIDRNWNDKVTDLIGLNITEYEQRTPRGDYLVLDVAGTGELKPGMLSESGHFTHGVGGTPHVILAPYLALDSGVYQVKVEQVDNGVSLELVEMSDVPVGRLNPGPVVDSDGLLNLVGRQYSVLIHASGKEEITVPADVYLLPRYERQMQVFEVLPGRTTVLVSPAPLPAPSGGPSAFLRELYKLVPTPAPSSAPSGAPSSPR